MSRISSPLDSTHQHAHDALGAQGRAALHESLLAWYARVRRDLPWRRRTDAYAIWLSEIMLQQTRVETVVPYFERFLATYPTVGALAEAPLDDVLTLWSGLGYYRRARLLHAAAREVAGAGGAFPDTAEGLRAIAGIGAYTAGAIASIAFGRRAALVDGNVARVLARLFAVEDDVRAAKGLARIWALAAELVPAREPGEWNQALMELGATVCAPREPRCLVCPVRAHCAARARGIERELPRLKAKPKPTPVRRIALVAASGGAVLLAKRRPEGTFGGMWEPPSIDATAGDAIAHARRGFAALLGKRVTALEPCGTLVHVLSHRRMQIDVVRGRIAALSPSLAASLALRGTEYEDVALVAVGDLAARGTTTLARKILAAAQIGYPRRSLPSRP